MIRMIQSKSADNAKSYFKDALQKSDYYVSDQEQRGVIHGKLADRLGLRGDITKDIFFALCDNTNPVTGEQLTPRTKIERTTGYDINFHVPKSVSIVNFLSKDKAIEQLFKDCVLQTMTDIEADIKTRVRVNNQDGERQTGEMLFVEFTHNTARPVEDNAPDPHLHSHCYVFNVTHDEVEGRLKAGQFRDINRDMPYYQARYYKRLADGLQKMGYNIRRTEKSFEIAGVPEPVIDLFSKRKNEVSRIAKEKGITGAKALNHLGAKTRSKKQKGLSMAELKQEWRKQIALTGYAQDATPIKITVADEYLKDNDQITPQFCVNKAADHLFERSSVVPTRKLQAEAYKNMPSDRSRLHWIRWIRRSMKTNPLSNTPKKRKRSVQLRRFLKKN
jgi:conjugative relaxase-like TrwC/TraI family protein